MDKEKYKRLECYWINLYEFVRKNEWKLERKSVEKIKKCQEKI